ncbi:MAG: 4-(cytidine 5'-diphospho)-2-C-methyl-D-erythritol kinase [Nitrospinae bacterium]|nr:4-(cytidine 5'-diphospho)-2-C-methyl-D-erythritol kinase [Nitrospinota bacterium]
MNELTLESHAKINLALKITGKYPDGYHQLETILQRISLKDRIVLREARKGITVTSDSAAVPLDSTNLACRAAEKIMARFGIDKGVDIHIEKKIPIGAGLGGGSSNAATVLRGLAQMWGLDAGREELSSLARELGADVPFFLYDNCARGFGRGDYLEPISTQCRWWVALIYPKIHISTAWVYGNFSMELTKNGDYIKILQLYLEENKREEIAEKLVNDLESVVFPAYPEIMGLKKDLLEQGASGALMSGSGSSVFGLFQDRSLAEKALKKLIGENEGFLAEFVA